MCCQPWRTSSVRSWRKVDLLARSRQSFLTHDRISERACLRQRVEAAITQRVSGFESRDFFKRLIYSGDRSASGSSPRRSSARIERTPSRAGLTGCHSSAAASRPAAATRGVPNVRRPAPRAAAPGSRRRRSPCRPGPARRPGRSRARPYPRRRRPARLPGRR